MPRARDPKDFVCTYRLEAQASRRGYRSIAGCDEVGRGALLGPLYAAAVILDSANPIPGLNDSKKLSPLERERLDIEIRAKALAFRVVAIPAAEVDAANVYEASRLAMLRALRQLRPAPDFIFTDAMPLSRGRDEIELLIPYRALVHGDARCASIAAASILAKVARDAHLTELDKLYPAYRLARNKGYGTPEHMQALACYGPCVEHRKTFEPVASYLNSLFPPPVAPPPAV
jgi:ribonuclease HII